MIDGNEHRTESQDCHEAMCDYDEPHRHGFACGPECPECHYEDGCNGICMTAADIGLGEYGDMVAYAHPDCPEHGDPMDAEPDEDVCDAGGLEDLRYVREEDVAGG